MQLASGKVEFIAYQVSLLWHNSFLVSLYPFQTDLLRTSHQTRVWGEQLMTFLGNPYVNTRCGQYALSYRLPVWGDLGMRYRGNLSGLSSICMYTRYRVYCRKSTL